MLLGGRATQAVTTCHVTGRESGVGIIIGEFAPSEMPPPSVIDLQEMMKEWNVMSKQINPKKLVFIVWSRRVVYLPHWWQRWDTNVVNRTRA